MITGLRLEPLAQHHVDGYQQMVREWIQAEGEYPHNDGALALRDFEAFLRDVAAERDGIGLPVGVQRQITFAGVDDSGDLVGEFRLRPWRREPYASGNGHLGYNVAHRHRRRGVATQALGVLRHLAADFGLPVVVFDVQQDNDGSIAVARANGGRIVHVEGNTLWFCCPT